MGGRRGGYAWHKEGTQLGHFTQLPLYAVHVIVVQHVIEVPAEHRLGVDNDHHDDGLAVDAP